ncbi:hypothetical protein Tco_1053139, partial [Tanacetum coccineum]
VDGVGDGGGMMRRWCGCGDEVRGGCDDGDDDESVIMKSLVKKKQKGAILELKRRHLKKVSNCINTPLKMDDPNISMEEYIRLQAEKALSHGETFNWQTATYRKREYCDDEDDSFTNFKTKFPAIVFDDITSNTSLSCESTVSPLSNNEIDFRISFDEYDDEDYTPSVSCIDDLDFFKDFENEFPTIVYNDALTSKSDFLTEPTVSPQHIDEFNLKNETSLSKCDEKEQNVLYFNNLFPFNVIYPDNLKWDKDNDNDEIDIEQSRDMSIIPSPNVINVDTQGSNKLLETIIMESLVKKKQKDAILELKRRHLKNTIFCTYTPYAAMKIRHISASSA